MQLILLEKVGRLGNIGDQVRVSPGFGRNWLIPNHKAVRATPENIKRVNDERSVLEQKAKELFEEAQKHAEVIRITKPVIAALASDEGKLYGSVGPNEIVEAMDKLGVPVRKRDIVMPQGIIHSIGTFEIEVNVHTDVMALLTIEVVQAK